MNLLDYCVLVGTMLAIAAYGVYRTRGTRKMEVYVHAHPRTHWFVIGVSVMATQASAITFLSTPGQGYESGLVFVQNYFGAPFALMIICIFLLPMFRGLKVDTAYEYLGRRFDMKTRLLGAALFLFQRGLQAGITIYAPAIVLSSVVGTPLGVTIVLITVVVLVYTVVGGSEAVNVTQRYQFLVIFLGMIAAGVVVLMKLPGLSARDALTVAAGYEKLNAVDFSTDPNKRYTFWSGLLGGLFLALSYFGTDQSQVQRYLSGMSLRESRLGLMFNALLKIPMQFLILLLGVLIFVFYHFERPPVFFNQIAWERQLQGPEGDMLRGLESEFNAAHERRATLVRQWLAAEKTGDPAASTFRGEAQAAHVEVEAARTQVKEIIAATQPRMAKDSDYIFISFVLSQLPHGLIGLLIAVFFAAAFSSKSAELNALASTSIVDFYRHVIRPGRADAHYVIVSKWLTVFWGVVAMGFALFVSLQENLIEAGNIVASLFYGVPLALFLVALFFKWIGGTAVFWGAIAAQGVVIIGYKTLNISYLWYNVIGCAACIAISGLIQVMVSERPEEV